MPDKNDPPPSRLEWGTGTRVRCPACDQFASVGEKHKCSKGRNRDPFIDPFVDRTP